MAVFQIGQQAIKPSTIGEIARGLNAYQSSKQAFEQQKQQKQMAELQMKQMQAQTFLTQQQGNLFGQPKQLNLLKFLLNQKAVESKLETNALGRKKTTAEIGQIGLPTPKTQEELDSLRARTDLAKSQIDPKIQAKRDADRDLVLAKLAGVENINEAYTKMLDPNTPPEERSRIIKSGILSKSSTTVNVGENPEKSAGEDAKIAEAFQAKADAINAANPDAPTRAVVKVSTKGVRTIATEPKPQASASERTDIADARASEDALGNLKILFDEEFVGPFKGRVGKVRDTIGFNPQLQSEFLAATSAFTNAVIKQITGAQMSEPEAKRIMKQIPRPEDPPTVWAARHKQSLLNITAMKKRRLQILKESGIRYGPNKKDGLTQEQKISILRKRGVPEEQIEAALAQEAK